MEHVLTVNVMQRLDLKTNIKNVMWKLIEKSPTICRNITKICASGNGDSKENIIRVRFIIGFYNEIIKKERKIRYAYLVS